MYDDSYSFIDYHDFKAHAFHCMGGLCEVLIDTLDTKISDQIFQIVYAEAKRLEEKYSRYRIDNIVFKINNSHGSPVKIDKETYHLLRFADSLYVASNGMFDITSGVLRKIWKFDGHSLPPNQEKINDLLVCIDWKKVTYNKSSMSLPSQWEIDFGGIGKEYAVDSACNKVKTLFNIPTLINFGGDIAVTGPKKNGLPWKIEVDQSDRSVLLYRGGVATSGDKNKYILIDGVKRSHILNPQTGYPILGAPRSVTVVAANCSEAGALSTISLLMGEDCEAFLKAEAEEYYIIP